MDFSKKYFCDELYKLDEERKKQKQLKKPIKPKKESLLQSKIPQKTAELPKRMLNAKIVQNKKAFSIKKENAISLIHQNFNFFSQYEEIDEIVDAFNKEFNNNYSREEILDILHRNSFNISAAFAQLKRKDFVSSFTQKEDYIIKFMADSELYQQLCVMKGKVNVERRKAYLQVNNY